MLVLNLPHDVVPERATIGVVGTLTPEFRGSREQASGAPPRELIVQKKAVSGSVTLLAKGSPGGGDVIDGLPLSVREAPDVQSALRTRPSPSIRIEVYDAPAALAEKSGEVQVQRGGEKRARRGEKE